MIASEKQISYLFDLVGRHPDFHRIHNYDVYEMTNEWVLDWLKEKYSDYINVLASDLTTMDSEDVSALITHLQQGEEERRKKEFNEVTGK